MRLLTKRRKFILSSLFLTFGLFFLSKVNFELKYRLIGGLSLLSGILTLWSLRESAFYLARWTTVILPVLFTAGVALFYFLLPGGWITTLTVLAFYFLGMYALFLTENIFSVASIRTISLFRSALAVGFLLTLITFFFLGNTIFSLKLYFWLNFLIFFIISFPICFFGIWSVKLEEKLSKDLILNSFSLAIFLAQIALALSFWPLTVTMASIFLTSTLYVLLGLVQSDRAERLFPQTVKSYVYIGFLVLLILIFSTQWG